VCVCVYVCVCVCVCVRVFNVHSMCLCVLAWGLPHFAETGKDDGKDKLKVHLIGALVHGHGSFVYTVYEDVQHDSNLTVECLTRTLKHVDNSNKPMPKKLHIQLDNTCRENKNVYMYAWCSWMVARGAFEEIQVSFLPVGHTHEDIDQFFSRISVHLRVVDCVTPSQFDDAVKLCFTPRPLVERVEYCSNWKAFIEPFLKDMHAHTEAEILHQRFVKQEGQPVFFTRKHCTDTWAGADADGTGLFLFNSAMPATMVAAKAVLETIQTVNKIYNDELLKLMIASLHSARKSSRLTDADAQTLRDIVEGMRFQQPRPYQHVGWPANNANS
jgi:hypothetical protein